MVRKWSNLNLPGALHYVTGNFKDRIPVFTQETGCKCFIDTLRTLLDKWPCKLIAYVLMPDHLHLIVNPKDGRIIEFTGELKSISARAIVQEVQEISFKVDSEGLASGLAGRVQSHTSLERMDDLAKDKLHSFKSGEGKTGEICKRLPLV